MHWKYIYHDTCLVDVSASFDENAKNFGMIIVGSPVRSSVLKSGTTRWLRLTAVHGTALELLDVSSSVAQCLTSRKCHMQTLFALYSSCAHCVPHASQVRTVRKKNMRKINRRWRLVSWVSITLSNKDPKNSKMPIACRFLNWATELLTTNTRGRKPCDNVILIPVNHRRTERELTWSTGS